MGLMIEDGTGQGYKLKIDDENRAVVKAIRESLEAHISHEEGQLYSATATDAAQATTEYGFYLKNTSTDKYLIISKFVVTAEQADVVWALHEVTGTAGGSAAITPKNLNLSSGNAAEATCYAGTAAVSGLTSAGTIMQKYHGAAKSTFSLDVSGAIVLGQGDAIALYYTGTGGVTHYNCQFYFH